VESRRVAGGPPVRRQVLYLGEISDNQEAAWRKSIEVFDEEKETPEQFCLFSSDKVIADDQVNALSLVLSEMRLLRPRSFGDCWLGCLLWDELGLLKRVAVLQKEAGRVKSFVKIREPGIQEPVNRQTFVCTFDRAAWKASLERDGSYILRASIPWDDFPAEMEKKAPVLWEWYMQLVRVEEAFKTLKSDLDLRPIHHQLQSRVEAHILVAFLSYCLSVTLRMKLRESADGLTPRAVLQSMSRIQMLEVHIPTTDGRMLILPRHTEPEAEQKLIMEHLEIELPRQPPPRIRQAELAGTMPPAALAE
jgi:hypothetical protein